jgi:hypothetical protein
VSAAGESVELFWSAREPVRLAQLRSVLASAPAPWISCFAQPRDRKIGEFLINGGRLCIADDERNALFVDFPRGRSRPSGMFPPLDCGAKCLFGFLKVAQLLQLDVSYGAGQQLDISDIPSIANALARPDLLPQFEDLAFDIGLVARAFRFRHLPAAPTPRWDILL